MDSLPIVYNPPRLSAWLNKQSVLAAKSKSYLLTDGSSIFIDDQQESVLNRIVEARNPMYLV